MGAPIVYTTSGAPSNPLAGGNYYWVKNMGNAYGHNPVGLVGADSLSGPPGGYHTLQVRCSGGNMGCHGDRFKENSMSGFHHQNEGER
jgi:hypothetical protein